MAREITDYNVALTVFGGTWGDLITPPVTPVPTTIFNRDTIVLETPNVFYWSWETTATGGRGSGVGQDSNAQFQECRCRVRLAWRLAGPENQYMTSVFVDGQYIQVTDIWMNPKLWTFDAQMATVDGLEVDHLSQVPQATTQRLGRVIETEITCNAVLVVRP